MSLGGLLGVALLLAACGEGPTESNEPRRCIVQVGEPLLPVPVPVPRASPVQDLNCGTDISPRDSSAIVTPLPRPVPIPVPGGD